MDMASIKTKIRNCMDKNQEIIISLGERIFNTPETGFREFKTSEILADEFKKLGFKCITAGNIPGFKATLDTGKAGPGIAIIGELDAVICPAHPLCNKETGAVHACGHNIQTADMLGAALGLLETANSGMLAGKMHLIAVPAEEYIELEYRKELKEKGVIKYLGGKPEFLYRGFFDDVDIAISLHAYPYDRKIAVEPTGNGCIVKKIKYLGKAAHAGGAPQEGINALYAAHLGLAAINSIRETFCEPGYIRVHPIITKGGDIVNTIPDDIHLETFVRGKTLDGIADANRKVTRALIGGAVAMGAKVEIEDMPGYFPMELDNNLINVLRALVPELTGGEELYELGHSTGSTDFGDLSLLMPALMPYVSGAVGTFHGADYKLVDPDTAYVLGSNLLAFLTVELLYDNAILANKVIESFKPYFKSKKAYFEYADSLFSKNTYPQYDIL